MMINAPMTPKTEVSLAFNFALWSLMTNVQSIGQPFQKLHLFSLSERDQNQASNTYT
jgi:hypothetical protein